MKPLVVVGAGRRAPFREYALAAMASRAELVLLDIDEPTWAKPYLRSFHLIQPPGWDQMLRTGRAALRSEDAAGIVTYDDRYTVAVAQLAQESGLPGSGLVAATACKDKWQTRTRLKSPELGGVAAQLVHSEAEAIAAARAIGLPVVLKPRALAASKGVVRVDAMSEIGPGFAAAATASVTDPVYTVPGVLVEECIEGDEFSIDSVIYQGQVRPVFVARKMLGPRPYFEEFGHVVTSRGLELLPGVAKFLQAVHESLDFHDGVTHAELRVAKDGYRIIEVNSRLGGDMIPYLGFLATGIDLAAAVADVGLGLAPVLTPSRDRAAAIRFIYPEHDMTLGAIEIPAAVRTQPGVERIVSLVSPGTPLRLPPAGYLSRIALVVTEGEDADACLATLDKALARITVRAAPRSGQLS